MKRHFCIGTDYYVVSSRVWPCKRSSKVKWSLTKRILLDFLRDSYNIVFRFYFERSYTCDRPCYFWQADPTDPSSEESRASSSWHKYKHFTAHVQRWLPGYQVEIKTQRMQAALNKKNNTARKQLDDAEVTFWVDTYKCHHRN